MKTTKNHKIFIGAVIGIFAMVFWIGGAIADIDTALEGAKKIGETAEQIEQMKKGFSTPGEEIKTQEVEQQEVNATAEESANATLAEQQEVNATAEESANISAEEALKKKAGEASQEYILKKTIGK
jgi:hypothetical protein